MDSMMTERTRGFLGLGDNVDESFVSFAGSTHWTQGFADHQGIGTNQNGVVAVMALTIPRLVAEQVSSESATALRLTAGRDFESLLDSFVRLLLGHGSQVLTNTFPAKGYLHFGSGNRPLVVS